MYMHRVTVKNLVVPHYQPRNTYVHTYIQYICGIRFLFTAHAFSRCTLFFKPLLKQHWDHSPYRNCMSTPLDRVLHLSIMPVDQYICNCIQSCECHVMVTCNTPSLGQSETLTQALASSSSTVPTGHPHPLWHSKVQAMTSSLQVSVHQAPADGLDYGQLLTVIQCIIKYYNLPYIRAHNPCTSLKV